MVCKSLKGLKLYVRHVHGHEQYMLYRYYYLYIYTYMFRSLFVGRRIYIALVLNYTRVGN